MPQIAKTSVGLRFSDKNSEIPLVPADLTSALGRPPTEAQTKGEAMTRRGKIIGASSGTPIIARFSSWHYSVEDRKPGDLDGQIRELFGALTNDLSVGAPWLQSTIRTCLSARLWPRRTREPG